MNDSVQWSANGNSIGRGRAAEVQQRQAIGDRMERIPLSLVTGFLGSGKTTFLKYTAAKLAQRRMAYLVNEFSALDVDGVILREIGPNVVSIPGGSIFCACLVTTFLYHLSEIPKKYHTAESPLEGVIVEASGIANPKVVADMLRETKLDAVYDLRCVVAVADPGSFRKLLMTLPNIRSQIEAADVVLLNKVDLFGEADVAATEQAIGQIKPEVRVVRAVRGVADIDLLSLCGSRGGLHGEYAPCADPHYGRFSVEFHGSVDLERLKAALLDMADDVYRAKGFVVTAMETVYLDWSAAGLTVEPCPLPAGVQPGLAMIVQGQSQGRMERFVQEVAAGRFDV